MANVSGFLQQLLNARYGKDVRQSIYDSIKAINKQLEESDSSALASAQVAQTAATEAKNAVGNIGTTVDNYIKNQSNVVTDDNFGEKANAYLPEYFKENPVDNVKDGSITAEKLSQMYIPMPLSASGTTGDGFLDVSGETLAKVESDGEFVILQDNCFVANEIEDTTINDITYSVKDGVLTLNGTSKSGVYTTISGVWQTLSEYLIGNAYALKLNVINGTVPSGLTVKPALNAGYVIALNASTTEVYIADLKSLEQSGDATIVIAPSITFDNLQIGLSLIPNVTSVSSFVNGKSIPIGNIIECKANMWGFGESTITKRTYSAPNFNPLQDKTIYADGDSICEGVVNKTSFADLVANNNGMVLTKKAVGGTTFAVRTDRTDSIYERVIAIDTEYDYILLEGGYNDIFSTTTLGAITAGFANSIDTTTVYGALEGICRHIKTNYPNTKLLFVIGHKLTFANGAIYEDQDQYWDAIREVCERYAVPYVDINKTGGLACYSEEWLSNYFAEGETMGTHPNILGYKMFYVPQIEAKLKTL